jgi:hypothetical protein
MFKLQTLNPGGIQTRIFYSSGEHADPVVVLVNNFILSIFEMDSEWEIFDKDGNQ